MFYSFITNITKKIKKNNTTPVASLALVAAALFLATACTKGSLVGSDILPSDDLISVTSDTSFTITAQTINDATPLIYNNSALLSDSLTTLATYLCGSYLDPIFGRTTSSIYAQFRPETTKPADIGSLPVDSILLILPYTFNIDQYGDTLAPQKFSVFRLSEDMALDGMYRSDKDFATNATPLKETTFIPTNVKTNRRYTHKFVKTKVTTTSPIERDSLVNYWTLPAYPAKELRIKLDMSLYNEFLANNTAFATNNAFSAYFKGLKIAPDSTFNSALLRFDLLSASAGIFVYQHDTVFKSAVNNPTIATPQNPIRRRVVDTIVYKKRLAYHDNTRARTLRFTHNRVGTPVATAIAATAPSQSSDMYLQGLGGPLVKLNFTNLKKLVAGGQKIIINKAELFVVTPEETDKRYKQPIILDAFRKNAYGTLVEIRDFKQSSVGSVNYYYGRKNIERINGVSCAVYNMNIGDHLQDIVNGTYDPYLYLTTFIKRERPERLVVKQNRALRHGFYIRIQYTKL